MADQSVRGRFVWHELVTPDANAAHAFYGKAIGWKPQPWEEDPSYVMFAAPRGPVGAAVARNGAVAHWLPYIGTGDLDETLELAKQKGASVLAGPDSLSSGSRYAVLQDPFGASFGIYESAQDYGEITPPQPGEHSWHELVSTDHDAAFDFYSALFGWEKLREHDMGEMGMYLIYGLGDVPFGGMMTMAGQSPAWVSYVQVRDVNQTAKKVQSAGGRVINGPLEVPGGDWVVQAVDPQGALFAAHATAADMAASMRKAEKKAEKKAKAKPRQLALDAETPAPVQDQETPAGEDVPPVDELVEAPAQQAPAEQAPPATELPAEEAPARRTPAKKAPAKKAPAKKAPAKKAPAKKAPAKKAPAKKAPAKKAPAKKAPAKKAPAKKAPAKKAPAKKAPAKRAPAKKAPAKKAPAKKAGRKAVRKASKKRPVAKGAGSQRTAARGARKSVKKAAGASSKTRSGGKKKAVQRPRKKK